MRLKLYQIIALNLPRQGEDISGRAIALNEKLNCYLPSGSGVDKGSFVSYSESHNERIVIRGSFHCMNEAGFYTHWVNYRVVVTPSLAHGFNLRVYGPFGREADLREHIADLYTHSLEQKVVDPYVDKG